MKKPRLSIFALFVLPLLLVLPTQSLQASDINLDPTFGKDGVVIMDLGDDENVTDIAIQKDGKIVVLAPNHFSSVATRNDIYVLRYETTGILDKTFGNNGVVHIDLGYSDTANALAIQSDGKIVVAGSTLAAPFTPDDLLLIRLQRDGSLDPDFAEGGILVTDLRSAGYPDQVAALAMSLQRDATSGEEKILVTGYMYTFVMGFTVPHIPLIRFDSQGRFDPTFDHDGIVLTDREGLVQGRALTVVPSTSPSAPGKIIIAGLSQFDPRIYDMAVLRYNDNGSPDPTFGSNGVVVTDLHEQSDRYPDSGEVANSLVIQPDGKIIVSGYKWQELHEFSIHVCCNDMFVARYTTSGSLDPTFGNKGYSTTSATFDVQRQGADAVLQSDGKILVAGSTFGANNGDLGLARFNSDGSLDASFGYSGIVQTDLGSTGRETANAIAIQPQDGKVILAGYTAIGNGPADVAIVRYSNSPSTIRIVQDAIPDNTRNYVYDSAFGPFRLDDTGSLPDDRDGVPNSISFNVAPGSYGFSQQMVTGWRVSEIRCDRPELATVNMPNRSVTLNIKSGDTVTCTFVTKQAVTVYARSYWDKNANRFYDVGEPWKSGVWTEILDSNGKQVAANFTDSNGQVGAFNLAPGAYSVCQTAPSGWWNTQPAKLDPRYGKPCYSFDVAPAGLVTGYFGWIDRPFVRSSEDDIANSNGLEITVFETPDEEESGNSRIYLPMIVQ